MPDLLAELEWRGFIHHATKDLAAHLATDRRTLYCGFDPTAPSFQVGNLMPLMLLRHFQLAGHRPIVLMGGGTGLIGDPSGKKSERPLLSEEQIRENVRRQRDQLVRLFDFDAKETRALVMNNADWLVDQRLVAFLRDVGKHFSINVMMQKESVKARLDAGISYTEFSYMLLQAYDFLHLFRKEGCTIQVGGSDQWGNITAGIDLIRRVADGAAHGLVAPLFTTATGAKFGKTEGGAIWLDPVMTSAYQFYQFWINTDDRDVERFLKLFTLLPRQEIEEWMKRHKKDPSRREAQGQLAAEVTTMVHGEDAKNNATGVSAVLFNDFDPRNAKASVFDEMAKEIPTASVSANSLGLVDALVQAGLASSKSEARRQVEQGGVYVNQQRVKDVDRKLDPSDWLAGGNLLLRKGKKDYALLRAERGGGR
ncbi:MAG TPA: tyrosine--tRNA ligase [Gemmatimonadales bacterium]|nr:tyrosine--tRNA ligase [Gemmatimonadales bacterium]